MGNTETGPLPIGARLRLLVYLLFGAVLVCAALWWVAGKVLCADEIGAPLPAPTVGGPAHKPFTVGGPTYVAYVWSRNCGATTQFDTRVFVKEPRGNWPDPREAVFETNMAPGFIQLTWVSPTHLRIEYRGGDDPDDEPHIRRAVSRWQGITITHRPRQTEDAPGSP